MLAIKDYINFIIFYQPDKNIEVSTLLSGNGTPSVLNRFEWDAGNQSLKEIQAVGLKQLKVSGTHLPKLGPFIKYNANSDSLSQEHYQGVLLNNNSPIPREFTPQRFSVAKRFITDPEVLKLYERMHGELQDYISRKSAGY